MLCAIGLSMKNEEMEQEAKTQEMRMSETELLERLVDSVQLIAIALDASSTYRNASVKDALFQLKAIRRNIGLRIIDKKAVEVA